jgi:hypothetical protein
MIKRQRAKVRLLYDTLLLTVELIESTLLCLSCRLTQSHGLFLSDLLFGFEELVFGTSFK